MMHVIKRHTISIGHAIDGIQWAIQTQPNFKVHLVISFFVLLASYLFQISFTEWIIIVLVITIGLVTEMINTAIEEATDAIDQKIRDDIKIAKDVAAGAMIIYAFGACIIGAVIFIPKVIVLLNLPTL